MKNVLIIQNKIPHYRIPFYNKLAEQYNILVLHSGEKSAKSENVYKEKIVPVWNLGKLKIQKGVLKEVQSGNYDIVIVMMDVFWIKNIIASFIFPKNINFIWWGIIASQNNIGNKIRGMFLRGLPTVFYTNSGVEKMEKLGFSSKNYTFCNNTIIIENREKCYLNSEKSSILFVGSLDQRKDLTTLLYAFNSIKDEFKNFNLNIIGEGEEKDRILEIIKVENLEDRVTLWGKINDNALLLEHYKKAICSVSFGQAGLSVLQSMGFGVPFVTKSNAISGGEITNIIHKKNGFICEDSLESLKEYLSILCKDTDQSVRMGENAYNHYSQFCTIENMAAKFANIIEHN